MLELATERHRAGDLAEARRLYRRVLSDQPAHPLALFRSGLLELQDGHPEAALAALTLAASLAPDAARHHFGCGQALGALGRWPEAALANERAVSLDPDFADAWMALGMARQQSGQRARGVLAYRRALELQPEDPAALGNLGALLLDLGETLEAVALLERARRGAPHEPAHAINLGLALNRCGEFAAAERVLRQASAERPDSPEAAFNLAQALHALDRPREALAAYQRAIALRPHYAEALNNLGNLHRELGELTAARRAYEAALGARPDYLIALNNLAALLRTLGHSDEAESLLRSGLALDPRHAVLYDTLGNVQKDAGALDEAIASFRRALELEPTLAAAHSNLAYSLSFQSFEAAPVLAECRRFEARFAAAIAPATSWRGAPEPERRLKLGYVSADFREHCQSLFTLPLLSRHDHTAFEVFCYSSVLRPDAITRQLSAHADVWREVRRLDDAALSECIRADGIDILVDLAMHMAGGRPLVFARKPAPIQIAWLAYPGTTGLAAVDFRLSDPRLDPDGSDAGYSERTLRLPDSFWCYDPLAQGPGVNPLPALARGHFTFGCLNNPCKLSDRTLELWSAVLRAVPDARLKLLAPQGRYRARLLARLEALGVAPARIDAVGFRPRAAYLAAYHDIDLGLDTVPYNGHTTSLDGLWMGVPTVTRIGATAVGRGGLSQLFQIGLTELAAHTDTAFVATAAALARDLPRLAALRAELRARLERSALMDAPRFARAIEGIYRSAWREHCARTALSR